MSPTFPCFASARRSVAPCSPTFAWCVLASLLAPTARADSPPLLGDEQALEEEQTPRERFRESSHPYEDPARHYFFLGLGFRYTLLPTWLMKAYTIEADRPIRAPRALAAELAYRKDGFQVAAALGFMKLDFDGAFRLKRDPIEDTEWMRADFRLLTLTGAVTWSTRFTDWFQLEYGLEAGLALLFGDLTRTEAVRRANGKWGACSSWASRSADPRNTLEHNPELPDPTPEELRYCEVPDGDPRVPPPASNRADENGEHYGVKATRGLRNGGVPTMLPVLGPRLSLRFKPAHQVVLRVDLPLPSIPFGFAGGIAAQYGF